MSQTHERHQSLWLLTAAPTIWAAHFLLSYVTAAIWCAKTSGAEAGESIAPVRIAITVYTCLALSGIAAIGHIGFKRSIYGGIESSRDADTPGDRHRFLGFATFLLATLSAIAVLFVGSVAIFFGTCH